MKRFEFSQEDESVIGIGPVIAGWIDGGRRPAYFFEVLFVNGETERVVHEKRGPGSDPTAKRRAVLDRIDRAAHLRKRGDFVLAHDEASFRALRAMALRISPMAAAHAA